MECPPSCSRSTLGVGRLAFLLVMSAAASVAMLERGEVALADGPPPASDAGAALPAPPPPSREFVAACTRGNAQYVARDYPAAADSFRQAIALRPHDALGPYLLGEALLAQGQPADADTTWTQALPDSERDPALHARLLFVLADVAERQKQWDEAKSRWVAYRALVSQMPAGAVFPATADSRIQAIEKALAQDLAYAPVRQRIADTADGGVFSDPAKSPPPK